MTDRALAGTRRRVAPFEDHGEWTRTARSRRLVQHLVGGLYLVTGGVHLGLVSADAQVYRHFADHAVVDVVRRGWADVVMAHPAFWGLMLMAGELTLGVLLLAGGRAARVGWYGVIAFHLLLLPFGWWMWIYAVPAALVLVGLALPDLKRATP